MNKYQTNYADTGSENFESGKRKKYQPKIEKMFNQIKMKVMKKNVMLLVMLCFGLSIASCSADEMFGNPELSVELSDDPKDRGDWDKSKIDFDNGGSDNP